MLFIAIVSDFLLEVLGEHIRRIISDHHWILVTLLLCNAFACEAMPILLDKLVSDIMAIVVSVTVLLFVGEIVPQALCTGPNQMKIAAFLSPFTYALMIITYPLSFPIAKFMDLVIGKHGKRLRSFHLRLSDQRVCLKAAVWLCVIIRTSMI